MFLTLPFPVIDPVAIPLSGKFHLFGIELGPLGLRWYSLAYIAGLVLGWRYLVGLARPRLAGLWGGTAPYTPPQADDYIASAALGVVLGGRLGYVLFYTPELLLTPLEIFKIWEGGMAFHGGLIGVAIATWLHCRHFKIPLLAQGDAVALAAPIGLFFGRIANFINGELWGRATDVPWAMVFPGAGPEPRHPSQLYEAALEGILLFTVLNLLAHRFGALKQRGLVTGVFLAGYGLIRALLETVRQPDAHMPHFPLGLTMGMMLSLPMIGIGIWLIRKAGGLKLAKA